MKLSDSFFVPAPLHRVEEVLLSAEYHLVVESQRRADATSVFAPRASLDGSPSFEVRHHAPGPRKVDAGARMQHTVSMKRFVYSPAEQTLRWAYAGPGDRYVDVRGSYELTPEGDGTCVRYSVDLRPHRSRLGHAHARIAAGVARQRFPIAREALRSRLRQLAPVPEQPLPVDIACLLASRAA